MKDLPRLIEAVPAADFRVRLAYSDGFVGEVDFAETIARGGIFSFLGDPARFATVSVARAGTALLWIDDVGDDIDFCADALRMKAEANAVRSMAAE